MLKMMQMMQMHQLMHQAGCDDAAVRHAMHQAGCDDAAVLNVAFCVLRCLD